MGNAISCYKGKMYRYKGEGIFYYPFFDKGRLMLTPLFHEGEDIEFFGNEDNPTADWMGYSLKFKN